MQLAETSARWSEPGNLGPGETATLNAKLAVLASAAMRAPADGGVVVVFARSSLPRGLYVSRR